LDLDQDALEGARYHANGLQGVINDAGQSFDMIGLIALRDKNRATVKSAIHYATEKGAMNVRMVSGDHFETCR